MTKLLVVSDTHGNITKLDDVVRKYQGQFDILVHLGDRCYDALTIQDTVPDVVIIKGNIELETPNLPEVGDYEKIIEWDGLKVFITHGHRYSVHSTLLFLKKRARKIGAGLVLFGHTHEKYLEVDGDIMYFNPGSLMENDYGIIHIDKGEIVSVEHGYLSERW